MRPRLRYRCLQAADDNRCNNIYKGEANDPTSLSNNRVNSVLFDRSGTMWVGTQDGLGKFDARTGTFKTYYEQDGLSGNAVSCVLEDDSGHLWMSTNNGLSVFGTQPAGVLGASQAWS